MIPLTGAEVAAVLGGALTGPVDPASVLTGPVVVDSRLVTRGSVFVALVGEHVDGHDFADAAVAAGAGLVIADRPLVGRGGPLPCVVVDDVEAALGALARASLAMLRSRPRTPSDEAKVTSLPVVIAVTGSVGKTTTKDLLAQLLGADAPTIAPVGSFNNTIGLPLTVLRVEETTRYVVLEMGASGVGHIAELTRIAPPDIAVVLAVGRAHLAGFGDIDAVARTKAELIEGLVPGGVALLNADDPRVAAMAVIAPGRVVTFGTSAGADVRGVGIRTDRTGRASFTLVASGGQAPVTLRLVGDHHVSNALAAAAVALELGINVEDVAARLSTATALSGHRMNVVERPDGVMVIDDSYNANPDSMRAALKALATIAGQDRRSVAVLGEMLELGAESRTAHDAIGRLLVRLNVALAVVVGPGAHPIADGANHEGSWGDEILVVDNLDEARAALAEVLLPGDVVLVKSSHGSGLWQLADELVEAGGHR